MTMKAQVKKLLPELQQESQQKREERAAIELNPQSIRMMVFEAAKAGQSAHRVRIPSNLDVRGTVAFEALQKWCKAEGLELSWEKRNVDLEDGRRMEIVEPEISGSRRDSSMLACCHTAADPPGYFVADAANLDAVMGPTLSKGS